MNNLMKYIFGIVLILVFLACNQPSKQEDTKQNTQEQVQVQMPDFDKDSAYYFVKQQVKFSPRVPNTKAHAACAQFLINTLGRYADTLIVMPLTAKAYNGTVLHGQNIIGIFNPDARKRVLLAAHWDSRPYADHDPNPANWRTPIDGANDGASGVGVLLEIARQLQIKSPQIGIDIIFFDLEDYGEPQDERRYEGENWCLGSQAWSKNPHTKNYRAQYGILLDMVGGENAKFAKEGHSRMYAPDIVDKVWGRAKTLGFFAYFQDIETDPIVDDHYYINKIRNIPTIDIIEWGGASSATEFNKYWHTINDNMDNIDKETLAVVGKVVLFVIRSEK